MVKCWGIQLFLAGVKKHRLQIDRSVGDTGD